VAVIYLVDKSAWEQVQHSKTARANLTRMGTFGQIATCPAIAGELLYSARNHADLVDLRGRLETLLWLETTDDAAHRVLGVQQQLARRGQHRGVSLVDLLVAATAEAHWATVLHYDSDYERIAEVTGQPHEWIVPRGDGHSRDT
jgi:predicted nucleic acid-binding protein